MVDPEPMASPELEVIKKAIVREILGVMGLESSNWAYSLIGPIFRPPAERMARFLVELEQEMRRVGWCAAVSSFLDRFVDNYRVMYAQRVPGAGPLLLMSNHPGAYDLLLLSACIGRDDLKIISSDVSIIRHLPTIASHFLPITQDPHRRMVALRGALRHLLDGGALLIFPRGDVEEDPSLTDQADKGFVRWSPSLELLLRKASGAQSVIAIVSGVLSRRWYQHPIVRVWKKSEQRQKVTEILQVAAQLIWSTPPAIAPTVSFSQPFRWDELNGGRSAEEHFMESITKIAREQLDLHKKSLKAWI